MRYHRDGYDDAWLDRLDSIVEGGDVPSPADDELLHVAGQLLNALSPLSELNDAAEDRRQRLGTHLNAKLLTTPPARRQRRWQQAFTMVAAALIFLILGPGIMFELNPSALNDAWQGFWRLPGAAPTNTNTFTPIANNVQILDAGPYRILLPNQPSQTGTPLPGLYQADYLVDNYYHVYLSVQATDQVEARTPTPPGLHTVYVSKTRMWLDHTDSGQNIIEWFENDKGAPWADCRAASDLGIDRLLVFVTSIRCGQLLLQPPSS
ncbi:MAG: hypothetical protein M3Z08_08255 [Chloroflexota bacterium]|nr:hypothetical protein [Chloroflexota bacterium]